MLEAFGVAIGAIALGWTVAAYVVDRIERRFDKIQESIDKVREIQDQDIEIINDKVLNLSSQIHSIEIKIVELNKEVSAQSQSLVIILQGMEERIEEHQRTLNEFSKIIYIRTTDAQ